MELTQYIEYKNNVNRALNLPLIDGDNFTLDDCNQLMESIESDLSPENLTCDGELGDDEVRDRERTLLRTKNQLEEVMNHLYHLSVSTRAYFLI